jgi:hypothetical protein
LLPILLYPLTLSLASGADLIINGSFENRTSPAPPTTGFSFGAPDAWVDLASGNPYLVHEDNVNVPGNSAIDGDVTVGGGGDIFLFQTFTTVNTAPLEISWWAYNELIEENEATNEFHETAVVIYPDGPIADFNVFIEWSGFRDASNDTAYTWVNETLTTSTSFAPGTYQLGLFVGGRSGADDLVVTQIPEPSAYALLVGVTAALFGWRRR